MNHQTVERCFSIGCLTMLGGVASMALLGLKFGRLCFLGSLVFLIAAMISTHFAGRYKKRVHEKALREVFTGFQGALPKLEMGSTYGFPTFLLIFRSEAEMNRAELSGRVARFKSGVQQLNSDDGSKRRPFDVERAFHLKWDATTLNIQWTEVDNG